MLVINHDVIMQMSLLLISTDTSVQQASLILDNNYYHHTVDDCLLPPNETKTSLQNLEELAFLRTGSKYQHISKLVYSILY